MEFLLAINMDSAAFENDEHGELGACIERAMRDYDRSPAEQRSGTVRDTNGNRVGEWIVAEHPITTKKGART